MRGKMCLAIVRETAAVVWSNTNKTRWEKIAYVGHVRILVHTVSRKLSSYIVAKSYFEFDRDCMPCDLLQLHVIKQSRNEFYIYPFGRMK